MDGYARRMPSAAGELWVCQLGRLSYGEGLALQEQVRDAREAGAVPDVLLLLEHEPVYTRGRRSDASELPMPASWYADRGIAVVDVDRGGKVTYHAPGQLVGYPIVRTDAVVDHVRGMERAIVAALAQAGVATRSRSDEGPDFTGVWAGERKIASIGVHVRRGITTHGFAVNVDMDLEPWTWIVPCGLTAPMTSIAQAGGTDDVACFRKRMADAYARELGLRQRLVTPARLHGERP